MGEVILLDRDYIIPHTNIYLDLNNSLYQIQQYQDYLIRPWQSADRTAAATVIRTSLAEYGLGWEATGADRDVLEVETFYLDRGGEFWVIEYQGQIVGTSAYYPINRGEKAVEIRKMYLMPIARGQGLGRHLLAELERIIATREYLEIWIETASILTQAVKLYESSGYQPAAGVETARCDRVYVKSITASHFCQASMELRQQSRQRS